MNNVDAETGNSLVPFLRWAGGKRRMAELISNLFPENYDNNKNRFFEPFIGGGALSFYLGNPLLSNYVPGSKLFINDINAELIATYRIVRDEPELLMKSIDKLALKLNKTEYEYVKSLIPRNEIERAAKFIYLNKTNFNGLWRVNSSGGYNVPWGKLKNPRIYDYKNILNCSNRLQKSTITNNPYTNALNRVKKGDVVYLDPPYIALSKTASFSNYAADGFNLFDQYALAGVIKSLSEMKVNVILSNSDTKLTRQIFGEDLMLHQIKVKRSISAQSSSRSEVHEIIGVNFELSKKIKTDKLVLI